ncbi:MAG: hypothetical protein WAU69_14005 [Solirubrobacteraceae bacterium]
MSKTGFQMRLTSALQAEVRKEIDAAGNPRRGFGVDPVAVWGVTEEEIKEFIRACRARGHGFGISRAARRQRREAWREELLWECRDAAMAGLELRWR